jgi:hypothetical protein
MHFCWKWLSRDDERDPREFREYVALFEDGQAGVPSVTDSSPLHGVALCPMGYWGCGVPKW